jgi:septum formation protein
MSVPPLPEPPPEPSPAPLSMPSTPGRSRRSAVPRHGWIWLASQSPRRRELLDQIGVGYRVLEPDADEDVEALEAERPGEAAPAYVQRVTSAKLDAACDRLQRRGAEPAPVLCADTTVALGRELLGKPRDAADAARMLARLAGRTHRVLTSVAVAVPARRGTAVRRAQVVHVSTVRFAPLARSEIAAYVASGEPFGKAGAYGIQGRAAAFVERIAGSHSSIMGLPLHETAVLLRAAGVVF